MADISVNATTAAATEQAQLYTRELWYDARVNSFCDKFMGEGPNNVFEVRRDFTKEKGDRINITLFADLTGKGRVVGTSATGFAVNLEGNEEEPSRHVFSVTLDHIRHAELLEGKMSEQRAAYEVRPAMKNTLSYWWQRRRDEIVFKKMSGVAYTDDGGSVTFGDTVAANSNVLYGGGKLAKADLNSGDTFTPNLLRKAKTMAMTGIYGSTTGWRMRPLIINGQAHYICILHPYQVFDLQGTPEWVNAQLYAGQRGWDNPIFSGALTNITAYA